MNNKKILCPKCNLPFDRIKEDYCNMYVSKCNHTFMIQCMENTYSILFYKNLTERFLLKPNSFDYINTNNKIKNIYVDIPKQEIVNEEFINNCMNFIFLYSENIIFD